MLLSLEVLFPYGWVETLSTNHNVVDGCNDHNSAKHDNCPVHVRRYGMSIGREAVTNISTRSSSAIAYDHLHCKDPDWSDTA